MHECIKIQQTKRTFILPDLFFLIASPPRNANNVSKLGELLKAGLIDP